MGSSSAPSVISHGASRHPRRNHMDYYSSVEGSLRSVVRSLDLVSVRRERLIKESRDIISLSAKTIVRLHASDVGEARKLSSEARRRLDELRKVASPDLTKYILMPEQEYVESMAMLAIKSGLRMPSVRALGVRPSSYVLGLLDAIGELKRSLYDDIRRDEITIAEEKFAMMESLYTLLSPLALYDNIVQGVRRKLDVARILMEDSRAAITEESRRSEFMAAVTDLSAKLGMAPRTAGERKNSPKKENRRNLAGFEKNSPEEAETLSYRGQTRQDREGEHLV